MKNKFREKVCAGIVLYNPEIELLEKNITAIENQVACIYLYDNGSGNSSEISEMLKRHDNIFYDYNSDNKGIAYGLNRILDFADSHGYEWFLSMDQDSVCSSNMIEEYSKYADDPKNGLISPFILNNGKRTLESYKSMKLSEYDYLVPTDCITSACLSRVSSVKEVGGFTDELFIDFVDIDLNCRISLAGYNIVRANKAYLVQRMGEAKKVPVLAKLYKLTKFEIFRKTQIVAVYSNMRLYHYARNSYVIHKKYSNAGYKATPFVVCLIFCYYTLTYPLSRNRIEMWKSMRKGFKDGKKMYISMNKSHG